MTPNPFSPSKMWGSKEVIEILNTANQGGKQLVDITLPSAAACSIYVRAEFLPGSTGQIWTVTYNFRIGVGRTNVALTRAVANQPTLGMPLEIVIPIQPIEALQVDVVVNGNPLPMIRVEVACEIAPLTLVPDIKPQEARFGDMPIVPDIQEVMQAPEGTAVPFDELQPMQEPMQNPHPARLRRAMQVEGPPPGFYPPPGFEGPPPHMIQQTPGQRLPPGFAPPGFYPPGVRPRRPW